MLELLSGGRETAVASKWHRRLPESWRAFTGTVLDRNPPRLAELLTVGELAQSLGVGERYVYRLVHERRVPFLKIGRYLRFDPAELDAWLDRARIAPVASTRDWS